MAPSHELNRKRWAEGQGLPGSRAGALIGGGSLAVGCPVSWGPGSAVGVDAPPSSLPAILDRRIGVVFGVRGIDGLGPVLRWMVSPAVPRRRSRRGWAADLPRPFPRGIPLAPRAQDFFDHAVLGGSSVNLPGPPLRHDRSDPAEAISPDVHAGEEMAARTSILVPHRGQVSGSSIQVRAMSRAQLRRLETRLRGWSSKE